MALPKSAIDREYKKFVEDSSGDVAVRVVVEDPIPISGTIAVNLDYTDDEVTVYGSQSVPLQQKVTTNDLIVTLDGESVAITGSVTANAGTNLDTSLLALESGGNLASILTSLQTIDNAISGNEMQVDVITMPTAALQFAVHSSITTTFYMGEAAVGTLTSAASWKIAKYTTASGVQVTWADGNSSYDNIWNNRESLSYS
jgi:hypothetical protein